MNVEKFLQLIENPSKIGKPEMEDLENLSLRYPWFFSSRQLQLYYHKNHNDIHFNDYLNKWSFSCPSPERLFDFLNSDNKESIINQDPGEILLIQKSSESSEKEIINEASETPLVDEQKSITEREPEIPLLNVTEDLVEVIENKPEQEPVSEVPIISVQEAITTEPLIIRAEQDIYTTGPENKEDEKSIWSQPEIIPEQRDAKLETYAPEITIAKTEEDQNKVIEETEQVSETSPQVIVENGTSSDDKKSQNESLAEIILKRCEEIKKKKQAEEAALTVFENTAPPVFTNESTPEKTIEKTEASDVIEPLTILSSENTDAVESIEIQKPIHDFETDTVAIPEKVPQVAVKEEAVSFTSENSVEKKQKKTSVFDNENDDIVRAEGESYADFVIRRCQEIKKRRQMQAEPAKEEVGKSEPLVTEQEKPVVKEESAVVATIESKDNESVKDDKILSDLSFDVSSFSLKPQKEEAIQDEQSKLNDIAIPEFSLDTGSFKLVPQLDDLPNADPVEEIISGSEEIKSDTEATEKIRGMFSEMPTMDELLKRPQDEQVKEPTEIPFDIFVPAYDISSLEEAALESEMKSGDELKDKKLGFADWLSEIENIKPLVKAGSAGIPDIIDEFIRKNPKIVVKRDSEVQSPYSSKDFNDEETPDVCSETLADLLVVQGKNEEAIKMYEKLSLLYPEKNIYFAARIEKLRRN